MPNNKVDLQNSNNVLEYENKLNDIFLNLKINNTYYCALSHIWYIIKNIKSLDDIECIMITDNVIYLQNICIDNFEYAKKVKQLPKKLIDKYKSYGININYDN